MANTSIVNVRLTVEEIARIDKQAEILGLKRSVYMRRVFTALQPTIVVRDLALVGAD